MTQRQPVMDRRMLIAGTLAGTLAAATHAGAQTAPPAFGSVAPALPMPTETVDLWPKGAPGMPAKPLVETVNERSTDPAVNNRAVFGISKPRMAVFRPVRPNGAAILIMPGGGYNWVVVDREGYEAAQWFAARGFTAFVLFYRLPHEGWAAGPDTCLSDAQRAMRLIRHRATDFGIDPARVAAMGFSAGGHLCADLATRFDAKIQDGVDKTDTLSARPMAAAPIYPVISMTRPMAHAGSRRNLIGEQAGPELERAHSPHLQVKANTPPCFLVHAEDDASVLVENSLLFRQALKDKGITVETHLFREGGHGFAMRRVIGKPAGAWPELFLAWARETQLA